MRSIGARERDPAKFGAALNYLTRNRWGEVTLTPDVATTAVYDPTLTPQSLIFLDPLTGTAAETWPIFVALEDRGFGVFTIWHGASAATDRTFRWIALGD